MSIDPLRDPAVAAHVLWYGRRDVPSAANLELAWKAIKGMAASDGKLSEPERAYLHGKMCTLATPPDVIDAVMRDEPRPEPPAKLLARIAVSDGARAAMGAWIVYEGLSVALADGELAVGELEAVQKSATAMGVRSATVDALAALVRDEAELRRRRIEALFGPAAAATLFGQ